jgi:hypothetical protein
MAKTNISLNVWQPQPTKIYAVQGEGDSRIINVSLLDSGGDAVDLTGASISIYAGLPHGNIVFFSGTIIDALNGQCAFTLPTSVTSAAGSVNLHILAIWPDPKALKAVNITLEVLPSNFEGAVEASDDFSALVDALATVQDIDSRAMKSTQIAGIPINDGITLAQLIAAGLAAGTNGQANDSAKLGGVLAANFPQVLNGFFSPTIYGYNTAGSPVFTCTCIYVKIDSLCCISATIRFSDLGGMAGPVIFGNLPFTITAYSTIAAAFAENLALASGHVILGMCGGTGNHMTMQVATSLGGPGFAWLDSSELSNTSALYFFGCYKA